MRPALLIGLAALLLFACDGGLPSLRPEYAPNSVTIHLETLGEYPTSVGRLVLEDVRSGQTIWEIHRSDGTPQLWEVAFQAGENPSQPDGVTGGGSFEVLVPRDAPGFFLEPSRKYRLTVWSKAGRSSRTTNFKLVTDSGHPVPPPS